MVSVYEKFYIDSLACESISSENSALISTGCLKNSETLSSCWGQKNSTYGKGESCKLPKSEFQPIDYNLASVSDMSIFGVSSKMSSLPRKKIIWNDVVINEINSTLLEGNKTVSINNPSKAVVFKKNFDNSYDEQLICNEQIQKINDYGNYNTINEPQSVRLTSDDSYSKYIKNSMFVKRNSPEVYKIKRRCYKNNEIYSRKEPQEMFRETQRNIFSIPKLNNSNFTKGKYVDYDSILNSIWQRANDYKEWVMCNQPKVFLLGDSHARFLAEILMKMLPGFKVEGTVKPGAECSIVMLSLQVVLQNIDKNDFVVLISGTNDMWSESLEEAKDVMYNAVSNAMNTNLLLCCVPNNYLEPGDSSVQYNIICFNEFYKDLVKSTKHTHLVDLYELKDRGLFTRHGLHFNHSGKIKICQMVSHKILDIINSIKA